MGLHEMAILESEMAVEFACGDLRLPIRRSQRLRALTLAAPGTERHEVGRLPALSRTIEEYQQAGWEMVGDTTSISPFKTTPTITIRFRKLDSS
jgi:hypothetical protein